MSTISLRSALLWIDQPAVKEKAKDVFGIVSLNFSAAVALSGIRQYVHSSLKPVLPLWDLKKLTVFSAKASAVVMLFSTKEAQKGIGWISCKILSSKQWEVIFGPNIHFAGNWRHPRHIVSLIGFGLGIPSVIYAAWLAFKEDQELEEGTKNALFSNRNVIFITAFLTLISRPSLHLTNMLARKAFR